MASNTILLLNVCRGRRRFKRQAEPVGEEEPESYAEAGHEACAQHYACDNQEEQKREAPLHSPLTLQWPRDSRLHLQPHFQSNGESQDLTPDFWLSILEELANMIY